MEKVNMKRLRARAGEPVPKPEGEGWRLDKATPVAGESDQVEYVFIQETDEENRVLLTQ